MEKGIRRGREFKRKEKGIVWGGREREHWEKRIDGYGG